MNCSSEVSAADLQTGCLQRIADAAELMAQNHADLVKERDDYKYLHEQDGKRIDALLRSNAALRGVITKLKKGER